MRGFLRVTAHWINIKDDSLQLKSQLLACYHFIYTGKRICEEFDKICEEYEIRKNVDIICDNGANMKKAFTTRFPGLVGEEDYLDDSDSGRAGEA